MSDNVLIAIIATCGAVISAVTVLGGAIFAYLASGKRLDKIDADLGLIRSDLIPFYRSLYEIQVKVENK